MDPKSGEFLLVSGSASSIKLLDEILDGYEMLCAVVTAIDTGLLEQWHRECPADCESPGKPDALNGLQPTNGEHKHAQ
ncbi:MAG: hypothetical protein ACYCY2_08755 [Acidithiobacillus ferriphilus]